MLGAGATGLLAPILVGLPVGVAVQAVATDDVGPAPDTGLAPWVFAVVYSGFAVLGLALAVLVIFHVLDRWGSLISQPPKQPWWPSTMAGAVGLLPFGAAMAYWGVAGVGDSGPQGMTLPAQRTVLVVTGVLSVAAFVVPEYVEPGSSVAATCLAGDLDGVLCHGISRSHARPALPGRQG